MIKIIRSSCVGIEETFGKFTRVLEPGIHFYVPLVTRISELQTNIQTMSYKISSKTKDNVFVDVHTSVSYKIEDPEKAFYTVRDARRQIEVSLEDVVRGSVSGLDLDKLFEDRDTIRQHVNEHLSDNMSLYGYGIDRVFVTEIEPEARVRNAMNEINASKREREAAQHKADAHRILLVAEAEADKERKKLQGEGMALLRRAVIDGYREGINEMSGKLGISAKEAMMITMTTQWLDSLEKISNSSNAKTIFCSSNPSIVSSTMEEFKKSLMEANES